VLGRYRWSVPAGRGLFFLSLVRERSSDGLSPSGTRWFFFFAPVFRFSDLPSVSSEASSGPQTRPGTTLAVPCSDFFEMQTFLFVD